MICQNPTSRAVSATIRSGAFNLTAPQIWVNPVFLGWTRIFDPRVFDTIQVFPGNSVDLSISELSLLLNQIQLNLIKFIINTNSN